MGASENRISASEDSGLGELFQNEEDDESKEQNIMGVKIRHVKCRSERQTQVIQRSGPLAPALLPTFSHAAVASDSLTA